MNDEFEPRDLRFEKYKQMYKNELVGSSLKKMDIHKRVAIAQENWQKAEKSEIEN